MAATIRFLASLPLAVALFLLLAAVLAAATIVEARQGREAAQWYIYQSPGFLGLLGALAVNIFCAAAIRFPWKRHQTGFVITHLGLLLLLFGALQSFRGGVEGTVSLAEGASTREFVLPHRSRIVAAWVGRPAEPPYEFSFDAGPVDWSPTKTLNLGEVDGVRARILRCFQSAHLVQDWGPDDSRHGGPAVKFQVTGADGARVAEQWLPDSRTGDVFVLGPLKLQLEQAASDPMLNDFLHPPTENLGEQGLLVMYYQDLVEKVAIDGSVGKKTNLGGSGFAVEIVEYLPNAVPDRLGRFTTKGEFPKNPVVELLVYVPGDAKPQRQIAMAKDPLLNLDGVYGRVCPVKFRYFHPAVKPSPALEMLRTSDGKLHGRVFLGGEFSLRDELKVGDKIGLPGGFEVTLVEYFPYARQLLRFEPGPSPNTDANSPADEPAALVEITAGGSTQTAWLHRNDNQNGSQILGTPQGALMLQFEHGKEPLGFTLELLKFRREFNPGAIGNATFASTVRILDPGQGVDQRREISMNRPLTYGQFTFYQAGFDEAGHGGATSKFHLARDPGRWSKYSGSLLVCVGIAVMFFMRAYFFKKVERSPVHPDAAVDAQPQSSGNAPRGKLLADCAN